MGLKGQVCPEDGLDSSQEPIKEVSPHSLSLATARLLVVVTHDDSGDHRERGTHTHLLYPNRYRNYFNLFSRRCDQIPGKKRLKEEGFVAAQSKKGPTTWLNGKVLAATLMT